VVQGKVILVLLQAEAEDMEVLQPLVEMALVVALMQQDLLVQLIQVVVVVVQAHQVHLLLKVVAAQVDIVKNLSIHHLPHMLTLLAQVEVAVRQEQADLLVVLVVQV
jgi:hypothetical protein